VRADRVSRRDFTLKAGQVTVSAGPISGSVEPGHRVTRTLTVKNTGSAPATWTAIERSGTSPGSPAPASAWKPIADLPIKVYDNAVDTVGGTVYSALGTNLSSGILNDLYAYDPQTNTWSQRADAPHASEEPTHGVIDGKIYYTGGWAPGEGISAATQVYDPASGTWATGADEPDPYGGSAGAVLDSKLYVVGGCQATGCGTTEVQVYDPATNTWSKTAAYPQPISWGACGAVDGKLYCAGGEVGSAPVPDAFVYDAASDSWSRAADLPISLAQPSYTAANGKLLLSGGLTVQNGNFVATVHGYAYDPQTGTWSTLPDAPTATTRGGGSSGMYRVGGTTHLPNVVSSAQVLEGYDQIESDVSWLSESPRQLTLKPGQKATISVTLDASGLTEAGSYTATLEQSTDTPYTLDPLPVSLRVVAVGS
jgi:N-acetylneuraminic acid mutarotase